MTPSDDSLVPPHMIKVYSFPIITIILIVVNVIVFFTTSAVTVEKSSTDIIQCLQSRFPQCLSRTSESEFLSCGTDNFFEGRTSVADTQSCLYSVNSDCIVDQQVVDSCFSNERGIYHTFAFIPALFSKGEHVWSLVTSLFLHGSWSHLVNNMFSLFLIGSFIEIRLKSHFKYITFYLLTGIIATLFYFAFNLESPVPTIGASGAIFALLGASLILRHRKYELDHTPRFFAGSNFRGFSPTYIIIVFILQIWSSFFGGEGIAYTAHIGGFIAGLILIRFFRSKET